VVVLELVFPTPVVTFNMVVYSCVVNKRSLQK